MPFIRNQSIVINGKKECCDCACEDGQAKAKRDGACDCCDCCPDVDLPDSVCVYCVGISSATNSSGCCTQSYRYCKDVQKLTLQANSCDYHNAAGVKVLEYDSAAGFWKGTFCTGAGEWPAVGGCEHITGKYYKADGTWTGGVGNLPAEEWLSDCVCDKGDDNPYVYGHQCEDDDDDPCCLEENQVCPQLEGVAFNPANEVCP